MAETKNHLSSQHTRDSSIQALLVFCTQWWQLLPHIWVTIIVSSKLESNIQTRCLFYACYYQIRFYTSTTSRSAKIVLMMSLEIRNPSGSVNLMNSVLSICPLGIFFTLEIKSKEWGKEARKRHGKRHHIIINVHEFVYFWSPYLCTIQKVQRHRKRYSSSVNDDTCQYRGSYLDAGMH